MQEYSPYVSACKQMYNIQQEEENHGRELGSEPQIVRLFFKCGSDCRRYNEPTHDEVAAVFVGDDGAPPANRDIVIYPRNRAPQRISYIYPILNYSYPILFPRGDLGWHNDMQHVEE